MSSNLSPRCSVLLLVTIGAAQAPRQDADLISQLASPAATFKARAELIRKVHSDPSVRLELDRKLPTLMAEASSEATLRAQGDSVSRNMAQIAGALKITSTIPELTRQLARPIPDGGGLYHSYHLLGDPYAHALYEMGPVAYPTLCKALRIGNEETRDRVVKILLLADTAEARAILTSHLPYEQDPSLKKSIEYMLARQKAESQPR
jgi:hypothetical protein